MATTQFFVLRIKVIGIRYRLMPHVSKTDTEKITNDQIMF